MSAFGAARKRLQEAGYSLTAAARLAARCPDAVPISEHIVKLKSGKYRLVSKKTGKNLGTFDSHEAAEKHERAVEYFKHQK